jgi:hypothetical protein
MEACKDLKYRELQQEIKTLRQLLEYYTDKNQNQ